MIDTAELDRCYQLVQDATRMQRTDPDTRDGLQRWLNAQNFDHEAFDEWLTQHTREWMRTGYAAQHGVFDLVRSGMLMGIQLGWILCLQNSPMSIDFPPADE